MQKLKPRMNQCADGLFADDLFSVLSDIYENFRAMLLTTGTLAIGTTTTKVKTSNQCYASAGGVFVSVAAQDLPVLVGTVVNGTFNCFVFSVDKNGVLYSQMGTTSGTTITGMRWPNVPPNRCVIGFVIINPTGTGHFVGGTTVLSDATVVPNAVYINTLGIFDLNSQIQ